MMTAIELLKLFPMAACAIEWRDYCGDEESLMLIAISVTLFRLMALKAANPLPGMTASLPFHDLDLMNALCLVAFYAIPRLYGKSCASRQGQGPHNKNNCEDNENTQNDE